MPVSGKQFEPPVCQSLHERFLLGRCDRALVAAEEQHWGFYVRQQRQGVYVLEAIVHRGSDIRWRPVHLMHDPIAQIWTGALLVEPIAKRLTALFPNPVSAHRVRGRRTVQSIGALNLIGNARRCVAQHQTGDAVGIGRREQQPDDPTRGFAHPMHSR